MQLIANYTSYYWVRNFLFYLVIAILCLLPSHSYAQLPVPQLVTKFENYNTQHGLSQSTIKGIVQDQQGFTWLATYDGLNRFDGYQFKVFRFDKENNNSLSSNLLTSLAVTSDGLIWIGTLDAGLNSFDTRTNEIIRYPLMRSNSITNTGRRITTLLVDSKNGLYVGTAASGAFYKSFNQKSFKALTLTQSGDADGQPLSVKTLGESKEGITWLASKRKGLFKVEPKNLSLQAFPIATHNGDSELKEVLIKPRVSSIVSDEKNSLILAIESEGLYRLDTRTAQLKKMTQYNLSRGNEITQILNKDKSTLLIATTDEGVETINLNNQKEQNVESSLQEKSNQQNQHYHVQEKRDNGISDNFVHSLYIDKSDTLWIGTEVGLSKFSNDNNRFGHWQFNGEDLAIGSINNSLWSFGVFNGHYFFGGEGGLSVVPINLGRALENPWLNKLQQSFKGVKVSDIDNWQDNILWLATSQGLVRVEAQTDVQGQLQLNIKRLFEGVVIKAIDVTSNGNVWIASLKKGLFQVNYLGDILQKLDELAGDSSVLKQAPISNVMQDSQENLWVLTENGLILRKSGEQSFNRFVFQSGQTRSLSNNYTVSILEDSLNKIWIGTGDGLNRYNPKSNDFQRFGVKDGLANNQVAGLIEDNQATLWVSTTGGLSKLEQGKERFRTYYASDGLQSNEFNASSVYRNGRYLLFGGTNGFNLFEPQALSDNQIAPAAALTDLLLFNKPIPQKRLQEEAIFNGSISATRTLVFGHKDSMITFEFAGLHFADPWRNQYAYKMEGYDAQWVYTSASKRFATYTSLPAGEFQFKLKSSNKDGIWSESPMSINVIKHPPWWLAWWAYSIYIITAFTCLYYFVRSQKLKLAKEQEYSRQLLKFDRMKDEFLAKTSHELRTPLNGIIGLSQSLIDGVGGRLSGVAAENLSIIASSGKRLANLVNDILDYSQLEHHGIKLRKQPVSLFSLVSVVIALCEALIEDRPIKMVNRVSDNLPMINADEARLEQILVNLVANAINHTQEGEVTINAFESEGMMTVSVMDNGPGIKLEQQADLFNSFTQFSVGTNNVQSGVGLGLAICKHLVELHGGTISARNNNSGAEFMFTIKDSAAVDITESQSNTGYDTQFSLQVTDHAVVKSNVPGIKERILVADDERVNCQVFANYLTQKNYDITLVGNGEEAMNAIENDPAYDLVILDVVMPKISGYQCCQLIRKKLNYFELPILMLSAKTQPNDIVTGLEAGANDYVSKPVDKAEFLARVETLLNLKKIHLLRQQRDQATEEAGENLKLALHQEKHDSLTGLPNRNKLKFHLRQAIQVAKVNHQSIALMFVGLDRFKHINDSLGHEKGDQVLKLIATRLGKTLRDRDSIVRFESDTFVIAIYELDSELSLVKKIVSKIAKQVSHVLNQPIEIESNPFRLSATIGISIYPHDSQSVNELFRHADITLHHAKSSKRGSFEFFSQDVEHEKSHHFELESLLYQAINKNEFRLVYQPQVLIKSKRMVGVEALIRWHQPIVGLVSPEKFIPIAEDMGIINEIGRWVIKQACKDMGQWQKKGYEIDRVAINLSAHQFKDHGLKAHIASCLKYNGLISSQLELEITEGVLMDNVNQTNQTLSEFKKLGHQMSIDDFGTGYSSLSYLKQFPVNSLKIDQSFIRDMLKDKESEAIVKSVIDLAKGLHLDTIAEGVETQAQWDRLAQLNCDQVQGYFISKPVSSEVLFANQLNNLTG
jgi:two-component system, sensor histidine kinase ChiS